MAHKQTQETERRGGKQGCISYWQPIAIELVEVALI